MQMLSVEVLSDVYQFAHQRFPNPPIVLDCGANIGMFTRTAVDRGAARIVSFEPSPRTADCLRHTFAAEIAAGKVTVMQKGVWNKAETLRFSAENQVNPGAHSITNSSAGTVTIETCTIDSVVSDLGLPRVDFIKMDIEGAEINALEGAASTIRRCRPLLGLGTEHTADIAGNNEAVIKKIRSIDPSYRVLCTEVHPTQSPSRGLTMTPFSLFFY
jgi:FkbM family methyltransferase